MNNTDARNKGHGHVTPRPDGYRSRCGGPAVCAVCQRERAAFEAATQPPQDERGQAYAKCWVCRMPMNGTSEDDCHCFHRRELATSAPAQQAGQGEPIGWLKPNESYAPNAFRWERTDTHTRPIFATSPHPMEEEMATLREALEAIMGYPEINSYLGRQIFNLARAALAGSKG